MRVWVGRKRPGSGTGTAFVLAMWFMYKSDPLSALLPSPPAFIPRILHAAKEATATQAFRSSAHVVMELIFARAAICCMHVPRGRKPNLQHATRQLYPFQMHRRASWMNRETAFYGCGREVRKPSNVAGQDGRVLPISLSLPCRWRWASIMVVYKRTLALTTLTDPCYAMRVDCGMACTALCSLTPCSSDEVLPGRTRVCG